MLIYHQISCRTYGRYMVASSYMYIMIYSIIPLLIHTYVFFVGNYERAYQVIDYSNNGIFYLFCAWIFSLIGFFGFNFGYRNKFSLVEKNIDSSKEARKDNNTFYKLKTWNITAFSALLIGLTCFVLWTSAYGGVFGVLEYASALRSGYNVGIENSYTVFKRFVPLIQFSNYIFLGILINYKKLYAFIFFAISLFFSVLYLLANDGRAPLVMHFVSLVVIILNLNIGYSKKISLKKAVLFSFVTLFAIHNVDIINSAVMKDGPLDLSFDVLGALREEFSFTVRSSQSIFIYLEEFPLTFRLPLEILSGVLGILPSYFRPEWLEKLEMLNTYYWKMNVGTEFYGGKPPDLIIVGIYTMNYFGVLLLPLLYGILIRKLDSLDSKNNNLFEKNIFFAALIYPVIRIVAYTNFDGITLSVFYVFVGYGLLWIAKKISL